MSETAQSVTNEVIPPTEPKSFTGVWDDLTHGHFLEMLTDLKTEAEAAIASGDQTLTKWARSTGTLASLGLVFLKATDPKVFDEAAGAVKTVEGLAEEADNLLTKTTP